MDKKYRQVGYDYNKLKQCDIDCKSIESSLFSHQADLRFMKITYQTFSQLTESFSKDMKSFNAKLKDNRVKRLSTDMNSDLNRSKETLLDVDHQYSLKCEKFNKIKDSLYSVIESQKEFNTICSKFNAWLTDMETNVNKQMSTTQNNDSVKQLEDQINNFQAFRTVIQSEHNTCNDIKRALNNINSKLDNNTITKPETHLTDISNSLFNRLDHLEKIVNLHLDRLNEQVLRTRDLKENLDSTNVWLNEIDNIYLNNNQEIISFDGLNHSIIVKDDQFEMYERLLNDLNARKDMLLSKTCDSSQNKLEIQQIIEKLESILNQIQTKNLKTKSLQTLMDEFNSNYEHLNLFIRNLYVKFEEIEKNIRQPESILNVIEQIYLLENSVKENNKVDEQLQPCIEKMRANFCPELISSEKLKLLEQDSNELKINFENLTHICDAQIEELNKIHNYKLKYNDLRVKLGEWLHEAELKTLQYEPIAVDPDTIERQYDLLQADSNEYDSKLIEFTELNTCVNELITLLNKYDPKTVTSASATFVKKNKTPKKYKGSNTTSNNNFNTESSSGTVKLGSCENEITIELNKLNELYQWLGERIDERKKDLLSALDLTKSYLHDLHSIDNSLNEFESVMKRLFNGNLNEIKLPLDRVMLMQCVGELKKMDTDINILNADIELVKKKGKQLIFDRATNDTVGLDFVRQELNALNEKFNHLSQLHSMLKDKLDSFLLNFNTYEHNYSTLDHNLEQKNQMLNILSTEQSTNDLIDTQIKQIDLLKNDLNKQDLNILDVLNKSADILIESSLNDKELVAKLTKINSDYNLLSTQMTTILEFKYKLKDMSNVFTNQSVKFNDNLNLIQIDLDQISNESILNKKGTEQALLELDSIEASRFVDCNLLLNDVKIASDQIIDLIRGNSATPNINISNNEFLMKTQQMANSMQTLLNYLNDLKLKFNEIYKDYQREEEENEKVKSNEQDNKLLNEIQTRIGQCQSNILKIFQEFDSKTKPIAHSSSASIASALKNEHEKYAQETLNAIKLDIELVNSKTIDFLQLKSDRDQVTITGLELQLDKLNFNFQKLESKLTDRTRQLDAALFKATKFEEKLKIVNDSLTHADAKLIDLNDCLFNFDNLDQIDVHLDECGQLIEKLDADSSDMDDFKEICEQLMENCENADDRNIIEKRMDNLVNRWNLLVRSLDERKSNLDFLNIHLKHLSSSYLNAKLFVDDLNLKFTSNLVLNCIEPIVIKSQYEKMRELNEILEKNFNLISDLKLDTSNLLEINVKSDDNKLVDYLPKTIGIQALNALCSMMDHTAIDEKVNEIELKYTDYKLQLDANFNLMHRLHPLCEKFSQTIAQLNQSVRKYESELTWLAASNDNESSEQEKVEQLNDLRKNILNNSDILEQQVENTLSTQIISELMNSQTPIECEEFKTDLNENIYVVKQNIEKFIYALDTYELEFKAKQEKHRELMGELDDLQQWLDEVENKSMNPEPILYEPDLLTQQISEQKMLNDEIQKQKQNLKQLDDKKKSLIRTKAIEDSIDLRDRLNRLNLQSQQLCDSNTIRLNELEEALAISQTFFETCQMIEKWFVEIKNDLAKADHNKQQQDSADNKQTKEAIKCELHLLKNIDRSLQEKKVDFESLNKNGLALARLCNKNNNGNFNLQALINASGSTAFAAASDLSENQQKDCQAAQQLKDQMNYSNERYDLFKQIVTKRREELESLLWKSAEFNDKLENLTSQLNASVEACEYAESISAHPDKLRLQIEDIKLILSDLDKRKQALDDLKNQRSINSALDKSSESSDELNIDKRLKDLFQLWHQLKDLSELRAKSLNEALECAETFWSDFHSLMDVVTDLEERVKQIESETVAMDPDSVIEQQQHQEQINREIDEYDASIAHFKDNSAMRLIELCGSSEHSEIEKTIEDLETCWARIKQLVQDREIELQQTFGKACEFQQELIEILEWITLQNEKFINLDSSLPTQDPTTIRFQIDLLKEFKDQIDPEQLKIQILNQKFNDLKTNTKTNQSFDVLASLQEPLNSANKEWKRLQNSIMERKSNLQNALLDMGQFNEALDEMLKWLERTDRSLDELGGNNQTTTDSDTQFVSDVDIQLAKLKVLQNDIKFQEQCVEKLKETGKNLIRNETTTGYGGKQSLVEIKQRVQLLIDNWQSCLTKLNEKQLLLNNKLYESQTYQCDLQDALLWLNEIESQLVASKPIGGLPETAREQLAKFMIIYEQIEANDELITTLISTGQTMTEQQFSLQQHRWLSVKRKADDRKDKLEMACKDANEFHSMLQKFIAWLTDTEKTLNMLRPVSRVLDSLTVQIGEHQIMQKNISERREQMLSLDKLGTHLKYFSQKQDAILIKNLLISVQNRWEKIVSRSAERTRDLERGFKEAKQFMDSWKDLTNWLTNSLASLSQEQLTTPIGNNPAKIRQLISKHKEFHRQLSQTQVSYDMCMKLGRRLVDKCESDHSDRPQLHEMLNDLKNKWQTLCFQSVERQKKLEEALLCSGQFREALQSLLEWLSRVEPTLADNASLNGDLESVHALIEDNQQFQQQLVYKAEQVAMVRKAASELISSNTNTNEEDNNNVQNQLDEMNHLWSRIEELSQDRTSRLETALKLAKEFNVQVRSRLEWLSAAEQQLKYSSNNMTGGSETESEILEQIELHQNFVRDLQEQETLVKQCIQLGQQLISSCIPEALINLKHSIAVVQSRWDEINQICELKCTRLSDSLEACKENEKMLNELTAWLQVAEATLTALEQKPIVNNLEQVEQLLMDHQEFQTQLQARQVKVEKITKNIFNTEIAAVAVVPKRSFKIPINNNNSGWKTPESKIKNPRVKNLSVSWRKVWNLSIERLDKLKKAIERLKEVSFIFYVFH